MGDCNHFISSADAQSARGKFQGRGATADPDTGRHSAPSGKFLFKTLHIRPHDKLCTLDNALDGRVNLLLDRTILCLEIDEWNRLSHSLWVARVAPKRIKKAERFRSASRTITPHGCGLYGKSI